MTTRVLLTAGVVVLSLVPAAHARTQSCGSVDGGIRHVTASGTTCKTAKKVAVAYRNGKRHPYSYSCTLHTRKDGSLKATCRRPGKLVTWIIFGRG